MCNETFSKVILLVFNCVFLTLGLGTLAVGFYVRFVRTELDAFIGSSLIPIATYICIAAGGVVVFVSLVGCAGTLTQNRTLLTVYIGFLFLIFLLEVAAGILGFLHHGKVEAMLDDNVKPAILEKYGYSKNQLVTTAVDVMQQEFECCGYIEPTDWYQADYYKDTDPDITLHRGSSVMPVSCCLALRNIGCNNVHSDLQRFPLGCKNKLKEIIEVNLMFLGAASLAIAVVQLLGIVLGISLYIKSGDDIEEF